MVTRWTCACTRTRMHLSFMCLQRKPTSWTSTRHSRRMQVTMGVANPSYPASGATSCRLRAWQHELGHMPRLRSAY
ncbi:hypothetical protein PYCCODRAFT_1025595 [Trametes coccinea BRFM310]|uniref:Uncharacterized protein n=1 Tax=Trametes coccinea (strain BRFM310) TaxID=1353009 RepID=A0A1Y2IAS6_TRAC3|nr:hypothetical protein PYCCODRAFT_1025595 [Trametes coccinea BRFM310]